MHALIIAVIQPTVTVSERPFRKYFVVLFTHIFTSMVVIFAIFISSVNSDSEETNRVAQLFHWSVGSGCHHASRKNSRVESTGSIRYPNKRGHYDSSNNNCSTRFNTVFITTVPTVNLCANVTGNLPSVQTVGDLSRCSFHLTC